MKKRDMPQQVPVKDSELAEEWVRRTNEPDVRAVGASKYREPREWPWQVHIWAAEFVRTNPLEREMRSAITAALAAVPGVKKVVQEDREKWIVAGDPSGEALVRAAARAIDRLQEKIRSHMESLRKK
jgi:hypothetical protein